MTTTLIRKCFMDCLGSTVKMHSPLEKKPLLLDLELPFPMKLRVYAYTCSNPPGGRALDEYKTVLNVGQPDKQVGNFDFSEGRIVIVTGYVESHQVFVLWDATKHKNFGFNKNLQVKQGTIIKATQNRTATQVRKTNGGNEIVIAVHTNHLLEGINQRISSP